MDIITKSLAALEPEHRLGRLVFFHPISDLTIPPEEPAASVGTYSRILEVLVKQLRIFRGRDPRHDGSLFFLFLGFLLFLKLVSTSVHVVAIAVEFHLGITPVLSGIQSRRRAR